MPDESDEEAMIAKHNCDEADEDWQDSRDDNALFENYISSPLLKMKNDENDNAKSCTEVR